MTWNRRRTLKKKLPLIYSSKSSLKGKRMRQFKLAALLLAAAMLASCGGSDHTDHATKVKFSSQVSFGDSWSDVGTYAVGQVAALKGGKYTINDVGADGKNAAKNWTEVVADKLGLPAPCAAQTGLDGSAALGFSVPVVNHPGCTSYAQGGARVTDPVGPRNKLLGTAGGGELGQLTVPVVKQMQNHLAAVGGSYKGDEIVFVTTGGNDVTMQLAGLTAGATAAATAAVTAAVPGQIAADIQSGACVPVDAQASNCQAAAIATLSATVGAAAAGAYVQTNSPAVVAAMGVAGAELAAYVKTQIVGKGAKYVVVINLPDASQTLEAIAAGKEAQALISSMVTTFNAQLKSGVSDNASVLYLDLYGFYRDLIANLGSHGLLNVTSPACDLSPAKNSLGFSLVCNRSNLAPGNVDKYLFADNSGHLTPFGYSLVSGFVLTGMAGKGWL
jgi:outer membrane lipase/esterase